MAKFALNKSTLHQEKNRLENYQRFYPSLELKQQQLLEERKKEQQRLRQQELDYQQYFEALLAKYPMIASEEFNLTDLVWIADYQLQTQSVVGVALPQLLDINLGERSFGHFTQPHWVDSLKQELAALLRMQLLMQLSRVREKKLFLAWQKTSQRVNLFANVLIPEAKAKISKIKVHLSDAERAAVIRAKISKAKTSRNHS